MTLDEMNQSLAACWPGFPPVLSMAKDGWEWQVVERDAHQYAKRVAAKRQGIVAIEFVRTGETWRRT